MPKHKIVERYDRCLGLVQEVLAHAHRAYLFDNSGTEPIWLAEYDPQGDCELRVARDRLPNWFHTWVGNG